MSDIKDKELKDLVFKLIDKKAPLYTNQCGSVIWDLSTYRITLTTLCNYCIQLTILKQFRCSIGNQFIINSYINLNELEYTKIKVFALATKEDFDERDISEISKLID